MTMISNGAPGAPTPAPSLLDTAVPAAGAGDAALALLGAALPGAAAVALPLFSQLLGDAEPAADGGAADAGVPAADEGADSAAGSAGLDAMNAMLALVLPP
ncbi:hypothetical protein GTP77_25700, partial [Massilia sp. FT127W]|nr:hypothetical protein [Pseudoduganella aquatica]